MARKYGDLLETENGRLVGGVADEYGNLSWGPGVDTSGGFDQYDFDNYLSGIIVIHVDLREFTKGVTE